MASKSSSSLKVKVTASLDSELVKAMDEVESPLFVVLSNPVGHGMEISIQCLRESYTVWIACGRLPPVIMDPEDMVILGLKDHSCHLRLELFVDDVVGLIAMDEFLLANHFQNSVHLLLRVVMKGFQAVMHGNPDELGIPPDRF